MHLSSRKYKYVENYSTGMKIKYKRTSNTTIQEIRCNIIYRYHKANDRSGHVYHLHPLDEVQERVNTWAKRILLGPDEKS